MKKLALFLIVILILTSCDNEHAKQGGDTKQSSSETASEKTTELKQKSDDTKAEKVSDKDSKSTTKKDEEKQSKAGEEVDYTFENDIKLKDVINFDKYKGFSDSQKKQLDEKGYLVLQQGNSDFIEERYHSAYEMANYSETPVFITTDAVLNAFDIFYSGSMIEFELIQFYLAQSEIALEMTKDLMAAYKENKDETMTQYYQNALAYIYTAHRLFHKYDMDDMFDEARSEVYRKYLRLQDEYKKLESEIPSEIKQISDTEYDRIMAASASEHSDMFGYKIDYSQYKPRGHYTSGAALKNYFLGQMWLSNPGFELEDSPKGVATSLILACELYSRKDLMDKWQKMYDITSYYSSASDDISVLDLQTIIKEHLKFDEDGYKNIGSKAVMDKIAVEIKKLREPKIKPVTFEGSGADFSDKKQFRMMGQRYNADQFILSKLSKPPKKPEVSSFEFFDVMGSKESGEIAQEIYNPRRWDGYEERLKGVKEIYKIKKDAIYPVDMYHNFLKVIDLALNRKVDRENPNVPPYMKGKDYKYMSINTALGAFAQLKHANVLYSKQMMAEMGAPEEKVGLHYLDPNVELYEELLSTMKDAKQKLENLGVNMTPKEDYDFIPVVKFIDTLETFVEVSKKELKGEKLTDKELMELAYFGGFCDAMVNEASSIKWQHGFKLEEKLLSRPVISDIATIDGMYLELGIGIPLDIYVLVKQNGKKVIAKGSLYSSYEFYNDERLTDESWLKMLGELNEYGTLKSLNEDMKLVKIMPYAKHFVTDEPNEIEEVNEELDW